MDGDRATAEKWTFKGERVKTMLLYPDIIDCDLVINIPIVKHHVLSNATIAVEELHGRDGQSGPLPPGLRHMPERPDPVDEAAVDDPRRRAGMLTAHGPTGGKLEDVAVRGTGAAGVDIVAVDTLGLELLGNPPATTEKAASRSSGSSKRASARSTTASWPSRRSPSHEPDAVRGLAGPPCGTVVRRWSWSCSVHWRWPRAGTATASRALRPAVLLPYRSAGAGPDLAGGPRHPGTLLFSLGTLLLTILLGRVFCGWFCPLGTLNAIAGRFLNFCTRPRRAEHWSPWQWTKYYLLGGLLLMAACSMHAGIILDPLVLLYRSTATWLLPGGQWLAEEVAARLGVGESARWLLREQVTEIERQAFFGGGLIGLVFLAILLLNRYRPRFWCRYICPLGALLGVFALRPFLQRKVDLATCNQCDLCGIDCHGAATGGPGESWKAAECFGCLNCTPACQRDSLRFQWVWPWRKAAQAEAAEKAAAALAPAARAASLPLKPRTKGANRSRRRFLRNASRVAGTAAGATAAMAVLRATPRRGARPATSISSVPPVPYPSATSSPAARPAGCA